MCSYALHQLNNSRIASISVPLCRCSAIRPTAARAKLRATLFALEFGRVLCSALEHHGFGAPPSFTIRTESRYIEEGFAGGHAGGAHPESWAEIKELCGALGGQGVRVAVDTDQSAKGAAGMKEARVLAHQVSMKLVKSKDWVDQRVLCVLAKCPSPSSMRTPADIVKHWCSEHLEGFKDGTLVISDNFGCKHKCSICSVCCRTKKGLGMHIRAKHEKWECEICSNQFSSLADLEAHCLGAHGAEVVGESFECEVCKKIFPEWMSLHQHTNDKHGIEALFWSQPV